MGRSVNQLIMYNNNKNNEQQENDGCGNRYAQNANANAK